MVLLFGHTGWSNSRCFHTVPASKLRKNPLLDADHPDAGVLNSAPIDKLVYTRVETGALGHGIRMHIPSEDPDLVCFNRDQ